MYQFTKAFENLYNKYNIEALSHGALEDKLGDVFEDYVVVVLGSDKLLSLAKNEALPENLDGVLFKSFLTKFSLNPSTISKMETARKIEKRENGSLPKTDVIVKATFINRDSVEFPISIKATKAKKVAVAEFSVDTISKECGIKDLQLIDLMKKHQNDGSAKHFSQKEKVELKTRLETYKNDFVRWVISGSTDSNIKDSRFPQAFLKFNLSKELHIKDFSLETIDEKVEKTLKTKYPTSSYKILIILN